MEASKRRKLEAAGFRVGSTEEFLELTPEESALVEMRLRLSAELRSLRKARKLTQAQLAERIGSSQSRVAKMEKAHPSVSFELLLRALLNLGRTRKELGKVIAA